MSNSPALCKLESYGTGAPAIDFWVKSRCAFRGMTPRDAQRGALSAKLPAQTRSIPLLFSGQVSELLYLTEKEEQ